MKTREEIVALWKEDYGEGLAMLEVLLDVRELLIEQSEDVGRCPHGSTGVCMCCVISNDLMRPAK